MTRSQATLATALALSLAVHAWVLWSPVFLGLRPFPQALPPVQVSIRVEVPPKPPVPPSPPRKVKHKAPAAATLLADPKAAPASLAAPPPPSAEDWQLASTYTLKNSKRYRHAWGQQVRSMMGTAVAGPDQGQVRFRITIAPDGSIAQVEELWSTSDKASRLAWQAIRKLPPLPPTPTGKPLVFEQTISFLPYETGWPPSYKQDCLPDPPVFRNPFAWDGQGVPPAQSDTALPQVAEASPQAGCDPASTATTIEEEERELARQINQNRWGR